MGRFLAAVLVVFFAWWISVTDAEVETEKKKLREQIAAHQREIERLKPLTSGYDNVGDRERREAQQLSDKLRSNGIGISPAEAHALLKTEKELMDE